MTERTASTVARHQSSGSCSAQPGLSILIGLCSPVAAPITWPSGRMITARVPVVPTSIPMRYGIRNRAVEKLEFRNHREACAFRTRMVGIMQNNSFGFFTGWNHLRMPLPAGLFPLPGLCRALHSLEDGLILYAVGEVRRR